MLFCGDGINDLSGLSTADVGYAVGATEASIAASVYTAKTSVAGVGTDDAGCLDAQSATTALTCLYDKGCWVKMWTPWHATMCVDNWTLLALFSSPRLCALYNGDRPDVYLEMSACRAAPDCFSVTHFI